jgi:protein gp37
MILGCTPASTGCAHCYARKIIEWGGHHFHDVRLFPEKLARLAEWRPNPDPAIPYRRGRGTRPMCFVVDCGDLFHPAVPDEFILDAFRAMAWNVVVDFQVLTKRSERMMTLLRSWEDTLAWQYPTNVILGVSVEKADFLYRIEQLKATPAMQRFVSFEPLLDQIPVEALVGTLSSLHWAPEGKPCLYTTNCLEAEPVCPCCGRVHGYSRDIAWVIVGAESGPDRRPFDVKWAVNVMRAVDFINQGVDEREERQGKVAFFAKQDSAPQPGRPLLLKPAQRDPIHQWPGTLEFPLWSAPIG